jgi:Flp pilus assembly pilin Flp
MRANISKFIKHEDGASTIECGMFAFGIALAIVVAVVNLVSDPNSNSAKIENSRQ